MSTWTKLAVILHADVVGSTALVQKDERLAHERIRDAFRRFSETITEYRGIAHEIRGDAIVAEFGLASDAVSASLAFQDRNRARNQLIQDEIRPQLRIGIALGEVVIADQTLTGAGVVLAQRLEQIAEPGAVAIQGSVRDSIPARFPFDYHDRGDQLVKGFDVPVRVFSCALRDGDDLPPPGAHERRAGRRLSSRRMLAGLGITMIAAVVLALWWQARTTRSDTGETTAAPLMTQRNRRTDTEQPPASSDRPSIAVLAFDNLSGDPDQDYFAEGLADDIITDLSKVAGLLVIARTSSFAYRGSSNTPVESIARQLGVRYVLEGSVRPVGDRIRINTQLVDASNKGHVWAERFDGQRTDPFTLTQRVLEGVLDAVKVRLTGADKDRLGKRYTESNEAYEAFLRGWTYYQQQRLESFGPARDAFERAVTIDPGYSRAYAALAALYWETHLREWHPALGADRPTVKARAFEFRDRAMENPTPLALTVDADMLLWVRKHDDAIRQVRRALELSPNDAHAQLKLAEILVFAGEPRGALRLVSETARLDPHGRPRQLYIQGLARFGLDEFADAAAAVREALELNPGFATPTVVLAAALGHLGEAGAARILDPYRTEYWGGAIANALLSFPYREDADVKRLEVGLRKAGLREFST